jgi:flagellar basal body-associated protein FliL
MRLLIALIMMAIFLGSGSSQSSEAADHSASPPATAEVMSGGPLAGSGKSGIDMPSLMAPVTVNGELHYYVYLAIRLELSSDGQKDLVLEKIPYIQDAFLREVHRASIALVDDPETVDGHGLTERLINVAAKVLGPGVVTGIEFRNIVRHGS